MFCSKCGKEVAEGSTFCSACGSKLTGEDILTPPPPIGKSKNTIAISIVIVILIILAITNPNQSDFQRYISKKMQEKANNNGNTNNSLNSFFSGLATFAIDKITERNNYFILSVYTINTTPLKFISENIPDNPKILGVLGQFIPLNEVFKDKEINIGQKAAPASEPAHTEVAINQMVRLQDVRHRVLNNYILGHIGVVEGTAVNRADFPISRILIKGEILDAYSVVLGEHTGYAGNILTDEELTNLSEEEILLKLSHPEGLNNSNDKIMPNGQIPFMIVFSHEPAGVIKTTVVTVGAERLL
jgi:hypothetical protein